MGSTSSSRTVKERADGREARITVAHCATPLTTCKRGVKHGSQPKTGRIGWTRRADADILIFINEDAAGLNRAEGGQQVVSNA